LDAGRGRDGFFFPCRTAACGCATFFTFVAAAGRAGRFATRGGPCCFTVAGAGLAARSPEPPAQPAARIGTRTQIAARAVTNGYPVNFGSACAGVAAGAVPPPPLSSVVVVVSVDVVSVAVVSVAVELVDESGVVVVIVETTVLLPVVIVVTIVVVASAWKGAAPAVNAAVAAPSVISTANAAPHTAYFLYCLLIPPPCFLDYKKAYPPLG
jgi:hypothetical protein